MKCTGRNRNHLFCFLTGLANVYLSSAGSNWNSNTFHFTRERTCILYRATVTSKTGVLPITPSVIITSCTFRFLHGKQCGRNGRGWSALPLPLSVFCCTASEVCPIIKKVWSGITRLEFHWTSSLSGYGSGRGAAEIFPRIIITPSIDIL